MTWSCPLFSNKQKIKGVFTTQLFLFTYQIIHQKLILTEVVSINTINVVHDDSISLPYVSRNKDELKERAS